VIADWAPTSTAVAPSATSATARATTESSVRGPGSENESGLAFTTPIRSGRDQLSVRVGRASNGGPW
jgi:hypothetical protein